MIFLIGWAIFYSLIRSESTESIYYFSESFSDSISSTSCTSYNPFGRT